jgi:hypothetical protein
MVSVLTAIRSITPTTSRSDYRPNPVESRGSVEVEQLSRQERLLYRQYKKEQVLSCSGLHDFSEHIGEYTAMLEVGDVDIGIES